MKISNISTGNKLSIKTFDQLEEGDTIYLAFSADRNIENIIYTVVDTSNKYISTNYCFTDLNPDKKETINCDRMLKLERKNDSGSFCRAVPSGCTYYVGKYAAGATSQELLLEVIKKYNPMLLKI